MVIIYQKFENVDGKIFKIEISVIALEKVNEMKYMGVPID